MGCEEIAWFPSVTVQLALVIYAEMYIAQNFLCCDVFVLLFLYINACSLFIKSV